MNTPFKISIFADGASRESILKHYREAKNGVGAIRGFTTNPTLMAKAGVTNYPAFAKEILSEVKDFPISFEVFSDTFSEMKRQAKIISSWGKNVNVKIPITNTKGLSSLMLIRELLDENIIVNVTAIFTREQWLNLREMLNFDDNLIISIFAGRIADTGIDPCPMMKQAVADFSEYKGAKILWASPREVLNLYQAEECGCHIITMTDDLISKIKNKGKPLTEFSLDTVKMFYDDAKEAGFSL